MINLYLSDIIFGIVKDNHTLSLDNVMYEFEKLFTNLLKIKKCYKDLIGEVLLSRNKNISGYSLDEIVRYINNKDLKSYISFILTKKQYIESEQSEIIVYNNIEYKSNIASHCCQNNGILISLIVNNQNINRLPYKDKYITVMHQENYDYIKKYILLDDTFYLSQIYLDMLNSGYNLFFHEQAYNTLCQKIFLSYSNDIVFRINSILHLNYFEDYDGDIIKEEGNKIYAIRNTNPMYRIYFMKNKKNIYFLELAYNHNKSNISNKIKSAEQRYKEKSELKDIFDIDDDRYKRKK
ncbi:MAG: hypothetical protein SPF17_01440 [Candidatus Mucispirillum faecigallinarum]|nr:hypothetical protein [Candidatus Mucispirillum faecigallinarum]